MNEQLIKFIELCLVDGVISDKEREVKKQILKEGNSLLQKSVFGKDLLIEKEC